MHSFLHYMPSFVSTFFLPRLLENNISSNHFLFTDVIVVQCMEGKEIIFPLSKDLGVAWLGVAWNSKKLVACVSPIVLRNVREQKFAIFTIIDDLVRPWYLCYFCNPPYSQIAEIFFDWGEVPILFPHTNHVFCIVSGGICTNEPVFSLDGVSPLKTTNVPNVVDINHTVLTNQPAARSQADPLEWRKGWRAV